MAGAHADWVLTRAGGHVAEKYRAALHFGSLCTAPAIFSAPPLRLAN